MENKKPAKVWGISWTTCKTSTDAPIIFFLSLGWNFGVKKRFNFTFRIKDKYFQNHLFPSTITDRENVET